MIGVPVPSNPGKSHDKDGPGLISTKRTELEPIEDIVQRITEASRYFPREKLAI